MIIFPESSGLQHKTRHKLDRVLTETIGKSTVSYGIYFYLLLADTFGQLIFYARSHTTENVILQNVVLQYLRQQCYLTVAYGINIHAKLR